MDQVREKKVAIVLGGTVPHCELIRQLKIRGYYTILIDYLKNPPASEIADEHIRESTLDKDIVLDIATRRDASLVIATCIDHANATACYVLEKMGKHVPYSYQTALDLTDKCRMKKILRENNIPTAKYQIVTASDNLIDIPIPLVVKPVDSNGSRGVKKITDKKQLSVALREAITASKSGRAIVEEYLDGFESSIYSYILDGNAFVILTNRRYVLEDNLTGLMPGVAMMYPASFSCEINEKIQKACCQCANAFKLENTPLLLQIKIHNNEVYIIELMPRIGGGQSYWNIKDLTGFDMIGAAIDSFEGKVPKIEYHAPRTINLTNHIYAHSGKIGYYKNIDTILESDLVKKVSILRKPGSNIVEDYSSGNRVLSYVVNGKDLGEIRERVDKVNQLIDIYDNQGVSIINRNLQVTI